MDKVRSVQPGQLVQASQINALVEAALTRIVGVGNVQVKRQGNQLAISVVDDRIINKAGTTPVWVPYSGA